MIKHLRKSKIHDGVDKLDLITCPECEGDGETLCECIDCGDEHYRDCSACEGTGQVRDPDADNPEKIAANRAARADWEAVQLEATFKFTRDDFRRIYQQMFGREASSDDVTAWAENINALAERAGDDFRVR